MIKQINANNKVATSRPKPLGEVGDFFRVKESYYEITSIVKKPLGSIATNHFKEEGCSSTAQFISIWKELHTIKGFDPFWEVYYHVFRKVY